MAKDLFDFNYSTKWPDPEKFPINDDTFDYHVKNQIVKDLAASYEYLIVTGFTSIANLVAFFGSDEFPNLSKLRIVIGYEPDERISKRLPHVSLTTEIKNYWLRQNISIMLCGPILNILQKIKDGTIDFRVKNKLHAKLYVGKKHAILGSSNFSKTGITTQLEANIRVESINQEEHQYQAIKTIAENYYAISEDYTTQIVDLLKKLLKDATWQEALARAIKEILEAEWMKDYPELYRAIMNTELWPSQKIGVARAMKIIQDQGNVLIADPTGSGKTKFATALAYTVFHWLWENGLRNHSNALIITPKQVLDNWEREQTHFKLFNSIKSMGLLSIGNEKNKKHLIKDIEQADILVIDEAHNYLNAGSQRSKSIVPKGSTHVILSTATPINKRSEDLLRLVEMLDVDNLSDNDLKEYLELRKAKFKQLDSSHIDKLRSYINQFIVRRTKKQLNKMIEREPKKYTNRNDHLCKYPKTKSETYLTGENDQDKAIAREIHRLANSLNGIHYLQTIKPPFYLDSEEDLKKYLIQRLHSAPALASFMVKSSLRSSHCALMEYLLGSDKAIRYYKVDSTKSKSGNIIAAIEKCAKALPKIELSPEWIPEEYKWLLDNDKYLKACESEIKTYNDILDNVKQLTGSRENTKAAYLIEKAKEFHKILAFDSTVLTLDYLQKVIVEKDSSIEVIVATGQKGSAKNRVKELYGLGGPSGKNTIALCSDAMAEGINLPDAKALVLLDMPSVLRKIEQRIGRLERMDSEHAEIYVYWPDDSEEFSLKGDKKILDILVVTESLIGNNVDIPKALYDKHLIQDLSTNSIIKAYEEFSKEEYEWVGVRDSTEYIYGLIDGPGALIDEETYKDLKDVDATVKTKISFVETNVRWSFFAFRGDSSRSAKWLLIDKRGKTHTDFAEIALKLKEYLGTSEEIVQRKWNEVNADAEIKNVIGILRRKEKDLLSWKKKRALKVSERLLRHLYDKTEVAKRDKKTLVAKILELFNLDQEGGEILDFDHFADLWLAILLPALDKKRGDRKRRRKIMTLNDLTHRDVTLSKEKLLGIYENCKYANTLDELIASCIIAVKIA